MRMGAIYNIVFNRKKKKLAADETALVQVEILFTDRTKKYVGTGVYLFQEQWDQRTRQVVDTNLAGRLNKRIGDFVGELRLHEFTIIDSGRQMIASDIDAYFAQPTKKSLSFHAFMLSAIKARNDIVVETRNFHNYVARLLKENGIVLFSDLTFEKIQAFDFFLRGSYLAQPTISKRHQVIKKYIHEAERSGMFDKTKNPYLNFSVSKGKHKIRTRLDDVEIDKLLKKEFADPDLNLTRDGYAFQIFTGISYKDLRVLRWSEHIRHIDGDMWIEGLRRKTDEFYSVYLVPEAVALMTKHKHEKRDLVFPLSNIWTQNRRLKVVAAACGIDKAITTHTGRHTAATKMLRDGVDVYTIKDILGHSKLETTEIYARLERSTIKKQMQKMKSGRIPEVEDPT